MIFFCPCNRIKTQSRNAFLHGNVTADQITWASSLNRIAQKMLSAKIIELFTKRYEFIINIQDLDEISNAKGNLRSISSHFKTMCSMASLSLTDAKTCVERLARFFALVF